MKQLSQLWQSYDLAEGQTGYWKVGPLKMWITRYANEWKLGTLSTHDLEDRKVETKIPATDVPGEGVEWHRYALKSTSATLTFKPMVSDRPMVIRPESPFSLPSNQETTIFIASTVWVKVTFGHPESTLVELPVYRPKDTWFGNSPAEGELCYAARTSAKLRLQELSQLSYRAISKVVLKNMVKEDLFLERMKVPMMCLNLYSTQAGQFVTETLIFEKEKKGEEIKLKTQRPLAKEFGETKIVSPARRPLENSIVSRALSSILG